MNNQLPSTRYELDASASYQGADVEGEGTIANISLSGALLEPASLPLPPGTALDLRVTRLPPSSGLEISSEVVRATESGFAVRFKDLDPEVVDLLRELLPARSTEGSPTPGSAAACLEGLLSQLGAYVRAWGMFGRSVDRL